MISFVIPTRNRPADLAETLRQLGECSLDDLGGPASDVIIVDNASEPPADAQARLGNGLGVTLRRLDHNAGAAARNVAAEIARNPWLVMLDDDSAPMPCDLAQCLAAAPTDLAAIGGEIRLPSGRREAGGAPEVIIGCGAAIRTQAFLAVGGYDPAFGYYAEEYDLCAKLIARGHRITHTRDLRFLHRKSPTMRSMDAILGRLVRNNGWTIRRYAPAHLAEATLEAMVARYRGIAEREAAIGGFEAGLDELNATIDAQPPAPLSDSAWQRFTGEAAVRSGLRSVLGGIDRVRLIARGKGDDIVERVVVSSGVQIDERAPIAVAATISPGPMLDAVEDRRGRGRGRVIAPYDLEHFPGTRRQPMGLENRRGIAAATVADRRTA